MGIGPRLAKRLSLPAMLAFALVGAALVAPAAAGAKPVTVDTKLGELTVKRGEASLAVDPAAAERARVNAQSAGSSLGRVPRCKGVPSVFGAFAFLVGSRGKARRKLIRFFRCFENSFLRPIELTLAYLEAVTIGDGTGACPLLVEAERIRLGGAACPERIQAEGPALAHREPTLKLLNFTKQRRGAHGEAIVILHNPRDAVLLELVVAPRRYWRISDTGDLLP
jgi:hypothetical protein